MLLKLRLIMLPYEKPFWMKEGVVISKSNELAIASMTQKKNNEIHALLALKKKVS